MNTFLKNDLGDILALKMKISQKVTLTDLGTELIPVIHKAINLLTLRKGELAIVEQSVGQGAWIF